MSNTNNTASQVSVENFVEELKNAKVEEVYGLNDDPFLDGVYRLYHNEMTVGSVTLTCERLDGDLTDYPVIEGLEKLNVVNEGGYKLSVRELDELINEHQSPFLYPSDPEKDVEATRQAEEKRIAEARARAQKAAAGATPVGTATATAATATPTTAPRQ